jgi:MinD superfamily P-loop ATPase
MKITIASGKGGTGKTTVALSLAAFYAQHEQRRCHLIDCDVDAANAHLFSSQKAERSEPAYVQKARVTEELCISCGACARACSYNAITMLLDKPLIFEELCHSCGACAHVCPTNAMHYENKAIGSFHFIEKDSLYNLSWGELNIGEVQAPELIRQLKQMDTDAEIILYDASPGAGCPVRETMLGSDIVLLVTEPTPFGLNDLKMAAALSLGMGIPTAILVNRSHGDEDIISSFSKESGIPIIGRIPFDRAYASSCSKGKILIHEHEELLENFKTIVQGLKRLSKKVEALPEFKVTEFSHQDVYKASNARKAPDVKEFVIMSGKGGTGKTTLSAALAGLTEESIFFDADVDASNLPILLKGKRRSEKRFVGGQKAHIDPDKCTHCDMCRTHCHFNAINETHQVISEACEGCGFCAMICPMNAIQMEKAETGYVFLSESDKGPVSHAFLHIGEENSGKLVSQVRDQAYGVVALEGQKQILGDGPPGTGCPVIAATTGADLAIIVTEPSMSGIHDMMRAVKLTKHFQLSALLIINKADMNSEQKRRIYDFCKEEQIEILGEIPFDETVEKALRQEKSIIDFPESMAAKAIVEIYQKLKHEYKMK